MLTYERRHPTHQGRGEGRAYPAGKAQLELSVGENRSDQAILPPIDPLDSPRTHAGIVWGSRLDMHPAVVAIAARSSQLSLIGEAGPVAFIVAGHHANGIRSGSGELGIESRMLSRRTVPSGCHYRQAQAMGQRQHGIEGGDRSTPGSGSPIVRQVQPQAQIDDRAVGRIGIREDAKHELDEGMAEHEQVAPGVFVQNPIQVDIAPRCDGIHQPRHR